MKAQKPDLSARLQKVEDEFVDLWNNMGTLWGISPTMARIHGLLYITGAALSMDDIMEKLGISRGNVSMNLTKLVEWGLVRRVHRRGDRRELLRSRGFGPSDQRRPRRQGRCRCGRRSCRRGRGSSGCWSRRWRRRRSSCRGGWRRRQLAGPCQGYAGGRRCQRHLAC